MWPSRIAFVLASVTACSGSSATPPRDPPPPDPSRPPCAAMCARIAACGAPSDFAGVEGCTRTCDEDPRQLTEPCRTPRRAYERCMSAAPCAAVAGVRTDLEAAKRGPCGAELEAVLACEPPIAEPPFIYFQF